MMKNQSKQRNPSFYNASLRPMQRTKGTEDEENRGRNRNNEVLCNPLWSSKAKPTLAESRWDRHKQAVVIFALNFGCIRIRLSP